MGKDFRQAGPLAIESGRKNAISWLARSLPLFGIMKNLLFPAVLAASAGLFPGSSDLYAQEATLRVGDNAPVLDVEHWIKGDPVTSFEPGQCYVVEFWATWCPPCKDSMPHLTKLQKELGEQVVIIGLSDESLDVAKTFLDQPEWAERTQYTLGTDPDRSVFKEYMDAAKQRGIPTSFLVNGEGKIEWIGHPTMMDRPLKKMLGMEVSADEPSPEMGMDIDMEAMMGKDWKSTEAAQPWMDKAVKSLQKEGMKYSFKQETTIKAGMSQDDIQEIPLIRQGSVVNGGALGTRIDSVTEMDLPMMPEPMQTTTEIVLANGDYIVNSESQMSMAPPGMHIISEKEAVDLQKEFSEFPQPPTMAPLFDPNPVYANPAGNLDQLFDMCSLDLASETDTRVVLRGEGSPMLAMMSSMGGGGQPSNPAVELVLDKKSGHPLELTVGSGEKPEFTMTFSKFAQVDEADLAGLVLDVDKQKLPKLADAIREQMEMMMQGGPDGPSGSEDFDGAEVEF
jgi:thiol-disulfide isomerase/thioredoxin